MMFRLTKLNVFLPRNRKASGSTVDRCFKVKKEIVPKETCESHNQLHSLPFNEFPFHFINFYKASVREVKSLPFHLNSFLSLLSCAERRYCCGPLCQAGDTKNIACSTELLRTFINLIIGQMTARNSVFKVILNIFFALVQVVVRTLLWPIYGGPGAKVPPLNDLILLDSATTLAHKIRTKKLTSVEVVQSFINRIKAVNPVLNCVVDERFEAALEEAKEADKLIASGTKSRDELEKEMPFLGVPFTTKDCISIKGMSCTAGLHSRRGFKAEEDAHIVALMRKAGAIPLAITNVSELCMWWEGVNPVYGRTNNNYNTNRIVGGSSSGEGCLLSSGGSAMGIGSDIGGSVRIPAFFNGVFGHKPSTGVGSLLGHYPLPSNEDQKSFLVIGPMSRFAKDLLPMLKVMAPEHAAKLKLDEPVDITKIKYHYMEDDTGSILISPVDKEIKNLIRKISSYYKKTHNITVNRVNLEKLRYSMALWFARMTIPEGPQLAVELANRNGSVNIFKEVLKFPFGRSNHTLPILCVAAVERCNAEYGSPKHKSFVDICSQLKSEFQDILGDNGVFIYPTHPTAAPYHIEPLFKPLNVGYTAVFNVLGFPSTHVPMGLNSEGLPIGIQVVGNINQDRLTLAVALELEKAFGGWVPGSTNV
ncbi:UNVERIFIED_CONTAM: hypothetical protein PYX00_003227 [Menopon gallinae]|uniref:Amidase domain-containing protein n=1 Tax=Menopon gallinae TaxID=328185 RepID=A0AAW2I042_9NEOP